MDKITIPFEDIRGLGNIIIPKTLSDYVNGSNANVSEDTANINDISTNVLKLEYYSVLSINITESSTFIPFSSGAEVQVAINVTDSSNVPVHDVRVDWEVDGDFTGHIVTDNSGEAVFEWLLNNYSFDVEFEIGASEHNPITAQTTVVTGCSSITLELDT